MEEQIGNIFGHENVSIQMKFYVAEYLGKKMIVKPIRNFINFIMRSLENSVNL